MALVKFGTQLDEDAARRFKALCAERGVTLTQATGRLVQLLLDDPAVQARVFDG